MGSEMCIRDRINVFERAGCLGGWLRGLDDVERGGRVGGLAPVCCSILQDGGGGGLMRDFNDCMFGDFIVLCLLLLNFIFALHIEHLLIFFPEISRLRS